MEGTVATVVVDARAVDVVTVDGGTDVTVGPTVAGDDEAGGSVVVATVVDGAAVVEGADVEDPCANATPVCSTTSTPTARPV